MFVRLFSSSSSCFTSFCFFSQRSDSGTVAYSFLAVLIITLSSFIQRSFRSWSLLSHHLSLSLYFRVVRLSRFIYAQPVVIFHLGFCFFGSRERADMDLCLRHGGFACNRTACISLACLHIFSTGRCVSRAVLQPSRRRAVEIASVPNELGLHVGLPATSRPQSIAVLQSSPSNGLPGRVVRLPVFSSSSCFHTCVTDRIDPCICHASSFPAHHRVCRSAVLPAKFCRPCSFRTARRSVCRPHSSPASPPP